MPSTSSAKPSASATRPVDTTTADQSEGDATGMMYRAAIGPINTSYYLPHFTRLEAADRPLVSWNWSAALFTLNWMAFRKLWSALLVYSGCVVGVALLLFGLGRLVFQFSQALELGLLALFVLAAFVLPGLFANGLFYTHCRVKMEHALRSSDTLPEACAVLNRHASSRQRLAWMMLGNAMALGVALAGYLNLPKPAAAPPQGQASLEADLRNLALDRALEAARKSAKAASAPASSAFEPLSAASAQALTASQPASAVTTQAQAQAQAPTLNTSAPAASESDPQAYAMHEPANASRMPYRTDAQADYEVVVERPEEAPPTAPAVAPTAAAQRLAVLAAKSAAPLVATAVKPVEKPTVKPPAKPAVKPAAPVAAKPVVKTPEKAPATKPVTALAKPAAKPSSTTSSKAKENSTAEPRFYINAGLFADDNNARNAYVKLGDAGFAASQQELKSKKGVLTRVRVGPYDTEHEAQAAAEKIRKLGLDALIFKP